MALFVTFRLLLAGDSWTEESTVLIFWLFRCLASFDMSTSRGSLIMSLYNWFWFFNKSVVPVMLVWSTFSILSRYFSSVLDYSPVLFSFEYESFDLVFTGLLLFSVVDLIGVGVGMINYWDYDFCITWWFCSDYFYTTLLYYIIYCAICIFLLDFRFFVSILATIILFFFDTVTCPS